MMSSNESDAVVAMETVRRNMTCPSLDTKIAEMMSATERGVASLLTSSVSIDGGGGVKTTSSARSVPITSSSCNSESGMDSKSTSLAYVGANGGVVMDGGIKLVTSSGESRLLLPHDGGGESSDVTVVVTSGVVDMDKLQVNVWRERRKRCKRLVLQFIAFLCSTIGLCCILASYALLGGFIFRAIEGGNELDIKEAVTARRKKLGMELWNYTLEVNVFHEFNWTKRVDDELIEYSKQIYTFVKESGWDGKFESESTQWTYVGSLLYSVTVITTIGYGHIAPKTTLGRVVTMFYAIFGIPLNFLTLANVGQFLAIGFRLLYRNVVRGVCCVYWREPDHDLIETYVTDLSANGSPGKIPEEAEEMPISASTIELKEEAWQCLNKNSMGDITMEMGERPKGGGDDRQQKGVGEGGRKRRRKKQQKQEYSLRVYVTQGMRNLINFKDIKKINVPIHVSVLTVFAYILLGATLFSKWEDWEIGKGMYFCFVTLTTIGFGDVIPGTTLNARDETVQSQEKLALCALYIYFGLALIAMCFDLVQQEIRCKFRQLGTRLGILQVKDTPEKKVKVKGKARLGQSKSASARTSSTGQANNSSTNTRRRAFQKARHNTVR